jgi:septum formation protein
MYRVAEGVRLVLASASPRRLELLSRLGLGFDLAPAQVDETLGPGEPPDQAALRLAQAKAASAAAAAPAAAVLAADTLVEAEGRVLGKPADDEEAKAMLELLSGREHRVVTGFCLRFAGRVDTGLGRSRVRLRRLAPAEIAAYVAGGEPRDKAGAYAVQGAGAALVEEVSGSYTNVVGLPLAACVELMLRRRVIAPAGVSPLH